MDLNLLLLHDDMRQGLSRLVESGTRAMLLGTRATDPNARGQDAYAPSSRGWPAFMRVNPLLDWGYHDVWAFLRALRAPYCGLYDQGYSSLGCVASTQRNAALRRPDGSYAPAHQLGNPLLERQGRSRSLPLLPKGRGGPARISPLQASESTASRSTETLAFPSLSLPPSVTVLPPIPGTPTCAARAPCAVLGLLPDALCPSDFLCCCPDDASGSSSPSTAFAAPAARDGELLAAFRQALARVAKGAGAAPGWDLVCLAVQPLSAAWQRDWALQAAAQGCAAVILVTHSAEERDEAAERARGLPHVACLACSDDDLGGAAQVRNARGVWLVSRSRFRRGAATAPNSNAHVFLCRRLFCWIWRGRG